MAASLETYRRKRDFSVTSEPQARKGRSKGFSFVIQKHAARRLHYDFRLELDGVLKSWAVTKGPSLVPGEKRLAVHVEDHPLDYGDFEGTIPQGQYGGGTVMLWDRGTWIPEGDPHRGYEKGHLDFRLDGEKLKGRWHLVRMRGRSGERADNWLLIKSEDDEARQSGEGDILDEETRSVKTGKSMDQIAGDRKAAQWHSKPAAAAKTPKAAGGSSPRARAAAPLDAKTQAQADASTAPRTQARRPRPAKKDPPDRLVFDIPAKARPASQPDFVEPELATLSDKPPQGQWLHEIKFDGYRMQAVCKNGRTRMRTRRGLDWTERFADIAKAISHLPVDSATLDGEIVAEDTSGVSDFAALQDALARGDETRLVYYAFDLLYLNGRDLRALPLVERKRLLSEILAAKPLPSLRYSEHFEEHGEKLLQHVCRLSAEGIVSKKPDAAYRSGRGGDWLKSKCTNRQEFVVIGFVPSSAQRKAIGSLVLGYYDDGRLIHAGRAGTGYSAKLAADLYKTLEAEKVSKPPTADPPSSDARRNVKWVSPDRVAEIEFRGWTGTGQLRQAAFKGLREDKDPREILREDKAASSPGGTNARDAGPAQVHVRLTHPDRVLWPEAGVTKSGLADYYAEVWPWMKPFVTGRPLALVRCPTGIARGCFFQKHAWDGMAASIERISDAHDPEPIVAIENLDGLIGLVQASVLEIHPWGARKADLDRPDMLTIDLDPGDNVAWQSLAAAARDVRDRLAAFKLRSFVKTTGGKGLHVVLPIDPVTPWAEAKAFCKGLAEAMAREAPDRYLAKSTKAQRNGRIFVDYLRNGRGATAVCGYSTRARPQPGVSTPLAWDELDAIASASHFTLLNLGQRLRYLKSDPWKGFFDLRQSLPAAAIGAKKGRR